jgi:hypothetical protein
MNQRLTVAGALVLITIAVVVMVFQDRGASPRTSRRSFPRSDRSGETRAINFRSLDVPRPTVRGAARDPFSFFHQPRVSTVSTMTTTNAVTRANPLPAPVPLPETAVLPVRFVGTLHKRAQTWGVFSDCAGYIGATAEGERVLGRWRVVGIGIESVSVESADGQHITVRMTGCPPR